MATMYENIEALDKEIARLHSKMSTLDPTADNYKAMRVTLDALYKLRNDVYKADATDLLERDKSETASKQKETEFELRRAELEAAKERLETETELKEAELEVRKTELEAAKERFEAEMSSKEKELENRSQEIFLNRDRLEAELELKRTEIALDRERLEAETKQQEEENELRRQELEQQEKHHKDEMKSQRRDRARDYITTGVNVATSIAKLALGLAACYVVAKEGYKFEETGVATSRAFKEEAKNVWDLFKSQIK